MKKVYFSKMAFAALAVAGLALTSCEKEDFKVNIPNVEIPEVIFPDGEVFLNLSSTSTDGKVLNAEYLNAVDGTNFDATKSYTGQQLSLMSVAGGYTPETKNVTVPTIKTGTLMYPINFVLTSLDESTTDVTIKTAPAQTPEEGTPDLLLSKSQTFTGNFKAGVPFNLKVQAPLATPFLSDAQRSALLNEVNKLTAPATRAATADLVQAKALLTAQIKGYASQPSYAEKELKGLTVTADAVSINIKWEVVPMTGKITFEANVNGNKYIVEGDYTQAGAANIVSDALAPDHGHGHGHGDNSNAGGGTSGSK